MAEGHSWAELVQRVRDEWGDALVPVAPEHVPPLLDARARDFLTTVGLPDVQVRDILLIGDERLLDVAERDGRQYVVVVVQQWYRYAIDVSTGWVQYLHDDPDYEVPTNSSIAAFVLAVGLLKHQLDDLRHATEESVAEAVDAIWSGLEEWDPDSLTDEESRWNVLLNEYGMEYD
ncbi:SUKH-4 family immunity protein [Dactylosporangium sp. NPDC049140]|uniref:SUKH-4 family immunity protein n=1 Tax=Dactylosporangium sp. NPDC049140 TaxID=3155647 RepID=UPI0033FEE3B3